MLLKGTSKRKTLPVIMIDVDGVIGYFDER
jgi:hypothetical protein